MKKKLLSLVCAACLLLCACGAPDGTAPQDPPPQDLRCFSTYSDPPIR